MRNRFTSIALVAALGVLLTGCGREKTKDFGIEENRGTQRSALEKLAERGSEELIKLSKEPNAKVRMDATYALGYIKDDPAATQRLIEMIEGEDSDDTINALMTLGLQGPDEAKEIFKKHIKSSIVDIRIATCIGIAEYGDSTLYPLIEEIATNDEEKMARSIASTTLMQIENGRYVPFAHKNK